MARHIWWCEGGGDRAWLVIDSVFLCTPVKGFWACLGNLPPHLPRRPETWISLCNLMLKLRGISRSSAILGSDTPQSNNRKGNSIHFPWETWCQTRYWRLLQATTAYTRACTDAKAALAPQLSGVTRVHHWHSARGLSVLYSKIWQVSCTSIDMGPFVFYHTTKNLCKYINVI